MTKKSKVKVPKIERNHRQANYIDMEDSIKCSFGADRLNMFKGVLLEQFLVIAKDTKRSTTRLMAKVVKANKTWRYYCHTYPISEGEEFELDEDSIAVEKEYVDGDMYCAMLIAIKVDPSILKDSFMCLDIDRDVVITAAEWLEEASGEKFNSDDLLDGLVDEMED